MKSSMSLKLMVLFLALAVGMTALAANGNKGDFQISSPVQVNGTTLPAGDYTAKWEGTGPAVQVSIVRNGKTLATVPAKLVQSEQKAADNAAEIQNGNSGQRELTALRFSGKKYSLELGSTTAQSMTTDNSTK
ncbi:MAG TPA: hypothetical protein VLN58_12515 [Verrucomicrobiae bacterium]|nr:hypothetical protein [Verrucomicrobiae bacterium]